jgi:hypothetical protein
VNVSGAVPDEGFTLSHVCEGTTAIGVFAVEAVTVKVCDTAGPPASPEKVNEEEETEMPVPAGGDTCALTAPAASNIKEIRAEFNVFK